MKKFLYIIASIILSAFILSNCTAKPSIIGTWKYEDPNAESYRQQSAGDPNYDPHTDYYIFNADGTFSELTIYELDYESVTIPGVYSAVDKQLSISYRGRVPDNLSGTVYDIVSLTDDKLVLWNPRAGGNAIYTRVK